MTTAPRSTTRRRLLRLALATIAAALAALAGLAPAASHATADPAPQAETQAQGWG
jgi:hypothetical protein